MRKFLPLTVFAIAFALVEAAVVVYLRQIFYPEGFNFPMKPIPPDTLMVETLREAATMAILVSVGIVAGSSAWKRFAFFMYVFGMWDIFYYVWLKLFLGWPESFFTPDILFLIPVVWTGPVLAPMIVALSLCVSAAVIVRYEESGAALNMKIIDIVWVVLGALIILYTFMVDAPLVERGLELPPYRWGLFFVGEVLGVFAFVRMLKRKNSG